VTDQYLTDPRDSTPVRMIGRIPANVATPRALEDVTGSKKETKGTRGPAPLGGQRTQFMRLILIGVRNVEACRRVGVNGRTGTRWRLGRRVVLSSGAVLEFAPVTTSRSSKSACTRYLSEDELVLIGGGLRSGATMTQIAETSAVRRRRSLGRVHRNSDESGAYRPFAAHSRALGRLPQPRRRRLTTDGALRAVVQEWLQPRWSPEQISHSLKVQQPEIPARHDSSFTPVLETKLTG
jgi:transposase, IS30 family